MTHNELMAQLRKMRERIVLAREIMPTCGCSERTIERRRIASAYLKEAELVAKEVYDEIEIQEGERLVRLVTA